MSKLLLYLFIVSFLFAACGSSDDRSPDTNITVPSQNGEECVIIPMPDKVHYEKIETYEATGNVLHTSTCQKQLEHKPTSYKEYFDINTSVGNAQANVTIEWT